MPKPVNTGNKQVSGPDYSTQIQPGQRLNPNGRPKGAKNKITKLFIEDLTQEWINRGNQALQDLTSKELVNALIAVLPKDVLLAIQGDTGPNWVISASPVLSSDDWFKQAQEAQLEEADKKLAISESLQIQRNSSHS